MPQTLQKTMRPPLSRSMSSREIMVRASKEIAKSVVVAKTVQVSARRTGLTAAASVTGTIAWGAGLVLARKLHPQYLDPVSANLVNQDPDLVMNGHVLLQTGDVVDRDGLRATFELCTGRFRQFHSRVVVRQFLWPYWEPVEGIDFDQHLVFDYAEVSHAALEELVSSSLAQGFSPLLPLWKCTVFPNFTRDDGARGSAILVKVHQCMGDGYSLAKMLFAAATAATAPPPSSPPSPRPSGLERAHRPGQIGKVLQAAQKLLLLKDDPPSVLKARKRLRPLDTCLASYLTTKISMAEVRKAAKAADSTTNGIILAALSAAFRTYQLRKGTAELVDPLCVVWVALRPLAEAFEVRDAPQPQEPSNQTFGPCYVRLPVSHEYEQRMGRVRAVADQVGQLKGSSEPELAQKIAGILGLLPMWLSSPIWHALSTKVSLSVSTFPSPPAQFQWAGVTPTSICAWAPPAGTVSSSVLINSFRGRLTIALAMDAEVFGREDVAFLNKTFDDELELLVASATPSRL